MTVHYFIEFYKYDPDEDAPWCYICAVSISKTDVCLISVVVKQQCLRLCFFPCPGMTDWFLLRRVSAARTVAVLSTRHHPSHPTSSSGKPKSISSFPSHSLVSLSAQILPQSWVATFSFTYSSFRFCGNPTDWQQFGQYFVWIVWYATGFRCCCLFPKRQGLRQMLETNVWVLASSPCLLLM